MIMWPHNEIKKVLQQVHECQSHGKNSIDFWDPEASAKREILSKGWESSRYLP